MPKSRQPKMAQETKTTRAAVSSSSANSTSTTTKIISSLSELPPLPRYPAILLDQFGVLHDGVTPYAGSIEATRHLAEDQERRLVLLSNSSRRACHALDKLGAMGFKREWFSGAVTSGEVAHRLLEARKRREEEGEEEIGGKEAAVVLDEQGAALDVARLGRRCFHVTWGARGAVSVDGLGLELVDSPEVADFILAHGTEAIGGSLGSSPIELGALRKILEQAARKNGQNVPLLCANPDIVTVNGAAGLVTMPGTLARWYAEAGGRVVLLGKPGPAIYAAAAALLFEGRDEEENSAGDDDEERRRRFPLLAIGDSLEHDVAGASGARCPSEGVESLFIGGGIHADELLLQAGKEGERKLDQGALERLLASRPEAQRPTLAMSWYQV